MSSQDCSDDQCMETDSDMGISIDNSKDLANGPNSSYLSTSPEDDVGLTMVRRQSDDLYLVPGTSNESLLYDEFSVIFKIKKKYSSGSSVL